MVASSPGLNISYIRLHAFFFPAMDLLLTVKMGKLMSWLDAKPSS